MSNVQHNIDNSINVNAPFVEVKGNVGNEELMKEVKKTVGKEIKQLEKKQVVALKTYMGRS